MIGNSQTATFQYNSPLQYSNADFFDYFSQVHRWQQRCDVSAYISSIQD